jgi:hypothetical protein
MDAAAHECEESYEDCMNSRAHRVRAAIMEALKNPIGLSRLSLVSIITRSQNSGVQLGGLPS